jgi:sugar phosphate isomerase/epimerase
MELALPYAAHIHAKDVFSDGVDWRFAPIGQGSLDYRRILALLDEKAPDLPLGIELPLRLDRSGRRAPERTGTRLPLEQIRQAVKSSLQFVTSHSTA